MLNRRKARIIKHAGGDWIALTLTVPECSRTSRFSGGKWRLVRMNHRLVRLDMSSSSSNSWNGKSYLAGGVNAVDIVGV